MKYSLIIYLLIFLYIFKNIDADDKAYNVSLSNIEPDSIQKILNKCAEFTGFVLDKSEQGDYKVNLVLALQDTSNVLLYSLINNRQAWSIKYNHVSYRYIRNSKGDSSDCIRDFDVFIDVENGNFLKAISRSTDSITLMHNPWKDISGEPNNDPKKYNFQLLNQFPSVKLLDALKIIKKKLRNPKEITAYLLKYKYKKEPKPSWVVDDPIWCIVSKDYIIVPDSLNQDKIYPSVDWYYIDALTGKNLISISCNKLPNAPK